MRFITIRDLRSNTVEEELNAIRNARAQAAVSRIRAKARAEGLDQLSMDQIDEIIARSRRERAVRQ